jgi:thioredoxin reductase (NADPH)
MSKELQTRPIILVWMRDAAGTESVAGQLEQRYSFDYDIVRVGDPKDLHTVELDRVALVLADVLSPDSAGLLAAIKQQSPSTRRAGVAPWGQPVASHDLQDLIRSGLVEWFVILPQVVPDEQFHRAITEFLEEWSRENNAVFEIVRIIDAGSAKGHRMRDLLQRNNVTHGVYDPSSELGRSLMEEHGFDADSLPAFVLFDGRALGDPTERELADAITGQATATPTEVDLIVIGAGPSGLATAVYATSEGLSVAVLEREAIGGQAGTTSMIRNYLGFQRGISGQELASRAFRQAWGFGAHVLFIRDAVAIVRAGDGFTVRLSDGAEINGGSIVLAQGVTYRRLGVPPLEALVGAGVYYGAAVTEAPSMLGKDVFVVGGGNSAGQAALHLAKFADSVTVLVRGDSLAESMSDYLIEDMDRAPNIDVEFGCEIVDGGGSFALEWMTLRDRATFIERRVQSGGLFVLIGAVPATSWLPEAVARDPWGFIYTGRDVEDAGAWPLERKALPFETGLPGTFAVGDVRFGSVKRVASAVGEGSVAVQSVHRYLSESPVTAPL